MNIFRFYTILVIIITTVNSLYAQYDLNKCSLYYKTDSLNVSYPYNLSGVTYNPIRNTLFMVNNYPSEIYEFTIEGDLLRVINLNNIGDTEGITWMYDNKYCVSSEESPSLPALFILEINENTISIDSSDTFTIFADYTYAFNTGTEGVAYDSLNEWFYTVRQEPMGVYKVEMNGDTEELFNADSMLSTILFQLSGIYYTYDLNSLIIVGVGIDYIQGVQVPTRKVVNVLMNGEIFTTFPLVDLIQTTQAEGISFTPDGNNMFVVGEPKEYRHFICINDPPLDFGLISPTVLDTFQVSTSTDETIPFIWESSFDVDSDVTYKLTVTLDYSGNIFINEYEDITDTTTGISGYEYANLMTDLDLTLWNIDYVIEASDEEFTVISQIGEFVLENISLSIDGEIIPEVFVLHQNYPNPFNPVTSFRYDLPEDGLVNITIYDMMGRIVKTLVNSSQTAGYKSIRWNAINDMGQPVSAGLYLYTIQAGEFRQTKKMVLLK